VTTFPECGTSKGRIDFFIRSKKWGVELLCDAVRLRDHNSRFTTCEYGTWVQNGNMTLLSSRACKTLGGELSICKSG
jgi:hypothetical protein